MRLNPRRCDSSNLQEILFVGGLEEEHRLIEAKTLSCWRRFDVKNSRKRGDQLGWRKRLGYENAFRNSLRDPFLRGLSSYVDYRKRSLFLPDAQGHFPAIHSAAQANVRNDSLEFLETAVEQGQRFFA